MTTRRASCTTPTAEEEEEDDSPTDTKWIHSQAKKSLRTDIILGTVTATMDAKEVYEMRQSYKAFPFVNFKNNLDSLLKAVAKDIARMQHDCETYGHDLSILQTLRAGSTPVLSWHLSDARKLLKTDMVAGLHKQLQPKEHRMTRPEYQLFNLEVFRKAIHSADDKKAKLVFRMEKKQFRAPPPATPAGPLAHIPMTFGANPQRKKGKGKLRKTLT